MTSQGALALATLAFIVAGSILWVVSVWTRTDMAGSMRLAAISVIGVLVLTGFTLLLASHS